MHKNAIKIFEGVKFLENLAKNSCFSRVLGLFGSCFLCYFGSTIVFFKKKVLATLPGINPKIKNPMKIMMPSCDPKDQNDPKGPMV